MLKSEQSLDEMISSEKSFDCIISEIRIPHISVDKILKKIKHTKLSTVPFIIFTSEEYPENLKIYSNSGADLVLHKPLDFFQYLEQAKSIIARITDAKNTYINRKGNWASSTQ